ncbi:glycosyl transferase family 36 [Dyella halodurans]|uniref:GH36-type glycosyl hydrolase domain-containing protein n=1 Tax=Dyella halodurans TaxID=1920171 RepID=A0ABV9C421_9GAMM|nr:glycosyl transferase family 36 [Dyella halodurans]
MSAHPSSRLDSALQVQLLSNGNLTVAVGAAGSGFSQWRDVAVTRWREDPVGDGWGSYVLLRDEESGDAWSASLQPYNAGAEPYTTERSGSHVRIAHQHDALQSSLEIVVDPDGDLEWRRVTLTNAGDRPRAISVTSYMELVLGPAGADAAHPAFSKMFVQTEWLPREQLLLATRRRRSPGEQEIWAGHLAQVATTKDPACDYETDRMRFLGRGRTLRDALAMQPGQALSRTHGCVLDPIFSLRRSVRLAPGDTVTVTFLTAVAHSRDAVLDLLSSAKQGQAGDDLLARAEARRDAGLGRLGADPAQAARYDHLVGAVLYACNPWRAPPSVLELAQGGAPLLWSVGISGDRPIVLLHIAGESARAGVAECLLAQRYWQSCRLGVDVVLLHAGHAERDACFAELVQQAQAQNALLSATAGAAPAQAFALAAQDLPEALRTGLMTAARIVLDASQGLPEPASRVITSVPGGDRAHQHGKPARSGDDVRASLPVEGGEFSNGTGAFVASGRSYAITLDDERCTPLPWVNVIANAGFGFLVSAEGGGYSWSDNSQQNTLTPWPNDPVSDTPHDILYLRDEDSGELWSATAAPIRVPRQRYVVEHGKGFSRFNHEAHGIGVELVQLVPPDDPVKLSQLRLHNGSTRRRRLAITLYVEWALGANGAVSAPFVITSRDPATGALLARNRWRAEFADRVAFIDLAGRRCSGSGDRLAFLGRYGSVARPAALVDGARLEERIGAGLSPCGVLQTVVEIAPGQRIDIAAMLGEASSDDAASALIEKYRQADLDAVLSDVRKRWDDVLDAVQVQTPSRAMDVLLNDWLLYQALVCRMWARTAYYQSSGAYGYRDQLQDAMALCIACPEVAREHLLRAAGRQFVQGDVQHWWLPPAGQGIRTRISDDRLWLPHVAAHYVATTNDTAVLDEVLPFLEGPAIKPGDADAFFQPGTSTEQASLYEHAARALDSSLTQGAHGLPLMGHGDWNDGMNLVGAEGRGESIWLAWFLLATMAAFEPLALARGDEDRVAAWHRYASGLRGVLDSNAAWDGDWYRRGYYDSGVPLGSHESDECKIDVIAQSWSVIAGVAQVEHAAKAMDAVDRYLVMHQEKIALLLAPPFDRTRENPGYIKGYPPGIRENGGQYTHGATWSIFAYAKLGQGERAMAMFDMLNPIHHSDTPQAVDRYKVEPYVSCADVYSVDPYIGRGGWTWYSGSAGWLYRAGVDAILGLRRRGDHLLLDPCIPASWPGFRMTYRYRGPTSRITRYEIAVENPDGVCRGVASVALDAAVLPAADTLIPLVDDGEVHAVRVVLGGDKAS